MRRLNAISIIGGTRGKGLSSEEPECAPERSGSHQKHEDSISEEYEYLPANFIEKRLFRLAL